jgi:predicted nucleic acid-binding Zn ribbon protein
MTVTKSSRVENERPRPRRNTHRDYFRSYDAICEHLKRFPQGLAPEDTDCTIQVFPCGRCGVAKALNDQPPKSDLLDEITPPDPLLAQHAEHLRKCGVWVRDRLAERGLLGGVHIFLFVCECHEVLLGPHRRVKGFTPSPELITALQEILIGVPLSYSDGEICPVCDRAIPENFGQSRLHAEFGETGDALSVHCWRFSS